MADQDQVDILLNGVVGWNDWRKTHPDVVPDLTGAVLAGGELRNANLQDAALTEADLYHASLYRANLRGANLMRANLRRANLIEADLSSAMLKRADLREADLLKAKLEGADMQAARLRKTYLGNSVLNGAKLDNADATWARFYRTEIEGATFKETSFGHTILAHLDFTHAVHLDKAKHDAPSSIGFDTLMLSAGSIPEEFLRACNVTTEMQSQVLGMYSTGRKQSCFISYSSEDSDFANALRDALNANGIDYWFAPEHAKWGRDLTEEISDGISAMDRVILICSKYSLENSDWVHYELAKTVDEEDRRRKSGVESWRMVFPIQLDDSLSQWDHKLSARLKEVLAGDFRNAKVPKSKGFEIAVLRLIDGLEHGQ